MTLQLTNNLYILYTYNAGQWVEYAHGCPWNHETALEMTAALACRGLLARAVVAS